MTLRNASFARQLLPGSALFLIFCAITADAHQVNLSTARIQLRPSRAVSVEVALKGSDVDRTIGSQVYDAATDRVDPSAVGEVAARVAAYVLARIEVSSSTGATCPSTEPHVTADGDGVRMHAVFSCQRVEGDLVYRSTLLTDLDPTARQIVLLGSGDASRQALLDATHPGVTISAPATTLWQTLHRYLSSGIEHIFLGYDHVAFLIAVLLWADRIWPVVKAVTAFTLAHSITLSLAALGVVTVSPAAVEAAIAASILFVAIENFFSANVGRRWWITFPFGLIHGLGFASALREFGLPKDALVPALAAFNIGVEIGQVAIVFIVVPTLLALDRLLAVNRPATSRPRFLVFALSGAIAALAFRWLLIRTMLV